MKDLMALQVVKYVSENEVHSTIYFYNPILSLNHNLKANYIFQTSLVLPCSMFGVALQHVWCGCAACLVWPFGVFGVALQHVWCGLTTCLVWLCSMFGVVVLHVWYGFAVCLEWLCCMFGVAVQCV